jgi:biotin carboxyl carrier protein
MTRPVKRELVVTAEGRERAVVIEPIPGASGQFQITLDGTVLEVDARQIRPGTWSILIDHQSFLVDLDRRRAGIAASVGDSEALLVVEDALHRRLAQAASAGRAKVASGDAIRAPIAGKVVKVLVAVGDVVPAHGAVIVLEAMKMENELATERGGTVTAIHKAAGQAVDTGDLLVELA